MTDIQPEHVSRDELERRLSERREEDRSRHRVVLALVGATVTLLTIAVSLGVAWGTSTAALSQKVEKSDQTRVDAAFDARITADESKIDNVYTLLRDIKATGDSTAIRVRQIACSGKAASCR